MTDPEGGGGRTRFSRPGEDRATAYCACCGKWYDVEGYGRHFPCPGGLLG